MTIIAYVNKLNSIVIDPNITINSGVSNGYKVTFVFQTPWKDDLTLYAVLKPVNDVAIKLKLDSTLSCVIPSQLYKRYAKLGIGIRGEYKQNDTIIEEQGTNLFYVPINYSGV